MTSKWITKGGLLLKRHPNRVLPVEIADETFEKTTKLNDNDWMLFDTEKDAWNQIHKEFTEDYPSTQNFKIFYRQILDKHLTNNEKGVDYPIDTLDPKKIVWWKRPIFYVGLYVVVSAAIYYVYINMRYLAKRLNEKIEEKPQWFI